MKKQLTKKRDRNRRAQRCYERLWTRVLEPNMRLMSQWQKVVAVVSDSQGLQLPESYVNLVFLQLDKLMLLYWSSEELNNELTKVARAAISAYLALVERAVRWSRVQLRLEDIPTVDVRTMVMECLLEAFWECDTVLYRAPLGVDPFADAIWPVTKRRLAARLGVECEADDSYYQRWLAELEAEDKSQFQLQLLQ